MGQRQAKTENAEGGRGSGEAAVDLRATLARKRWRRFLSMPRKRLRSPLSFTNSQERQRFDPHVDRAPVGGGIG